MPSRDNILIDNVNISDNLLHSSGTMPNGIGSYKPAQSEVKVVDAKTGGVKGSKLARFCLIPAEFLWALAEHYGKGEKKYAARNWEKGYAWGLTVDAMERHWNLFKLGERYDLHKPDCPKDCNEHTESHHLVAAAWHCVALFIFDIRGLGTNDINGGVK